MNRVLTDELLVTVTQRPEAAALATWDALASSIPGGDVAQLSAWAEVRRGANFEPFYLLASRGHQIVGGALILKRKLPVLGALCYVPYGPLISPEADRAAVVAVLTDALRQFARRKVMLLFVQPPLDAHDLSAELQRRGFRPSQAGIAPVASLRLDLTNDEDTLRAGLAKRLQTWTRRWPARGVHVRRGTQDDIPLFAALHAATAQHQGFPPFSVDYLDTLYGLLAPSGSAEVFIAEIDGRPVAARLYTACGGVLKLRLVGMSRDDEGAKLSVAAAVEWEAIRWAKAKGYRWFDFGGIREAAISAIAKEGPASSALTSPEAFKAKFGGTPFHYPTPVEIITPSAVRVTYDLSRRWPVTRRLIEQAARMLRTSRGLGVRGNPDQVK